MQILCIPVIDNGGFCRVSFFQDKYPVRIFVSRYAVRSINLPMKAIHLMLRMKYVIDRSIRPRLWRQQGMGFSVKYDEIGFMPIASVSRMGWSVLPLQTWLRQGFYVQPV
jgi:hypothetical protein